jgi:hypothetical protein
MYPIFASKSFLFVLLAYCLVPFACPGGQTYTLSDLGYGSFSEGELDGISLSRGGHLRLAPGLEEVADFSEEHLWAAVPDGDGGLYLTMGREVQLVHLPASGDWKPVFATGGLFAPGLAVSAEGDVYVAASPDPVIYRLREGKAPAEVFYVPEVRYVWNLTVADGALWVTTGLPAQLIRIPLEGGEAAVVFETKDDHFMEHFVVETSGWQHLLGTGSGGVVYTVDPEGKGSGLMVLAEEEIRGLGPGTDGSVWVLASGEGAASDERADADPEAAFAEAMSGKEADDSPERSNAKSGGMLYQRTKDGFVIPVWSGRDLSPSALGFFGEQLRLIGTEEDGLIYAVEDRDRWSIATRLPAGGTILAIEPDGEGALWIASSQPAAVYRFGGGSAEKGKFVSRVLDGRQAVRFGQIEFLVEGNPELTVETRSGNTPTPDATWNDWEPAELRPSPGAQRGPIASEAGRYLQYRLELRETTADDAVIRTRVFLRLPEVLPIVTHFTSIAEDLEARERIENGRHLKYESAFSQRALREFSQGERKRLQFERTGAPFGRTFIWRVQDPNGRPVLADLRLYPLTEKGSVMHLAEGIEDPFYVLPTEGLAEGFYQAELGVRSPGTAAWAEDGIGRRLSEPFLVDRTAPAIEVDSLTREDGRITVTFSVTDGFSVIEKVELRQVGGSPHEAIPLDGFSDGLEERYRIAIPGAGRLSAAIHIEAMDELGNRALWVEEGN